MADVEVEVPTIHMNGTSKQMLSEQIGNAVTAIRYAYDYVRECAPNGRDYYVKPGSLERAQDQHMARLRKLDEVLAELDAIAWGIELQTHNIQHSGGATGTNS